MKDYKSNSKSDAGCVKEFKEEKRELLANGGGRYSKDNPMELKQRADKLAKVVKKKAY